MRNGVNVASVVLPVLLLATEVTSVLAQTASAPTSKPIVLLRIVEQSKAKTMQSLSLNTSLPRRAGSGGTPG